MGNDFYSFTFTKRLLFIAVSSPGGIPYLKEGFSFQKLKRPQLI
jgi:hypothetical protein